MWIILATSVVLHLVAAENHILDLVNMSICLFVVLRISAFFLQPSIGSQQNTNSDSPGLLCKKNPKEQILTTCWGKFIYVVEIQFSHCFLFVQGKGDGYWL